MVSTAGPNLRALFFYAQHPLVLLCPHPAQAVVRTEESCVKEVVRLVGADKKSGRAMSCHVKPAVFWRFLFWDLVIFVMTIDEDSLFCALFVLEFSKKASEERPSVGDIFDRVYLAVCVVFVGGQIEDTGCVCSVSTPFDT